jgi:hypothetical protein
MAGGVERQTTNVRAALGLLDNGIRGNHAAAMADLVREFSQTSFVMKALPFAAAAGGFVFLGSIIAGAVEKIREMREEQQKLGMDQTKMGTAVNEAFGSLDEKILTAEKRADELRNDHLGALHKELELINRQSMGELVHSFETVAKAADVVFGDLKSHWYTFGNGADGAKHALEQFQTQYNSLLLQGKDKEASDLLAGTRDSAQKVLDAQKSASSGGLGALGAPKWQNEAEGMRVIGVLKRAGIGYTKDDIAAVETLLSALNAQIGLEARIGELKKLDSGNATRSTAGDMSRQSSEAARASAETAMRMGQMALAADRTTANARLAAQHASIAERTQADIDFANKEYSLQLAGNAQQIAALDKLAKDYPNQLKAMQDKAAELTLQNHTQVAEIQARGGQEAAEKALRDMQESEREKIDATQQGSMARLAAIDQALKAEAAANLQGEDSYRALLRQRVETTRQMAEEELKARLSGVESHTDDATKRNTADLEKQKLSPSWGQKSIEQRAAIETMAAQREYAIKQQGLTQQAALLVTSGAAETSQLQTIQNKQIALITQYEDQVALIREKAAAQQEEQQHEAMAQMENSFAQSFMRVLGRHESFTRMMSTAAEQMTSNLIAAAIAAANGLDSDKLKVAESAARHGFLWGSQYGGIAAPVLAPAMAATFFAGAMAFESGGIVPGVGRGDIVPARLEPGEGIVPGGVMDGLAKMARAGGFGHGHGDTHIHNSYHQHTIHALDGASVERVLADHADKFEASYHATARRKNR